MRLNTPPKKTESIRVRLSDEELNEITRKAMQYTDGNLSAWVLYASKNYVPSKDELILDEKKRGR